MRHSVIAAVLATGLVAAACTPQDINSTLDRSCNAMTSAYNVFLAATVSGEISERTINQVETAYANTRILCDTDVVNTEDAVVRVTLTIATIVRAYKDAKS